MTRVFIRRTLFVAVGGSAVAFIAFALWEWFAWPLR